MVPQTLELLHLETNAMLTDQIQGNQPLQLIHLLDLSLVQDPKVHRCWAPRVFPPVQIPLAQVWRQNPIMLPLGLA